MKKTIFLLGLIFLIVDVSIAQTPLVNNVNTTQNKLVPEVKTAAFFDVSEPLSVMVEASRINNHSRIFTNYKVTKNKFPVVITGNGVKLPDPLGAIQRKYVPTKAENLIMNASFDGSDANDNTNGIAPPDTDGDVSPDYYVQSINNVTTIFDKTGAIVTAPFNTSAFWAGFNGFDGTNDGDPIVLWDENAGTDGRWFVSQFAVPHTDGKMYELIAVSATNDPNGSYYRYAFEYPFMPDYPKVGIWPDAYYIGYNAFDQNNSNSSEGGYVSAFERDEMIAGNPAAREVRFLDPSIFALFPVDADVFPPLGTPGYFINDMVATYTGNDEVYIYKFVVDWSNTANSTFGLDQTIKVTPYGFFGTDTEAEQKSSTQKLDLLHYRTMYRAYFRPFGTHNSLLLSRTVDPVNSNGTGAVRWYEFRNVGSGPWSTYQEGTYDPDDGLWRWMPSIAMNGNGDIAIAYSLSGLTKDPAIAGVARRSTDPLGVMTTNEMEFFAGNTAQSGVSRWGDYSMLSIDPSDDYSFWFTTEYSDGGWSWNTRIIHFQLPLIDPPSNVAAAPVSFFEDKGGQVTVTGTNITACTFEIGTVAGSVVSNDGSTAVVDFPAANYSNSTLTVSNANGSDTDNSNITVNTRNIIPVGGGTDPHPTIQSAVDGLHAWYGTTAFNVGDLAGTKTINVYTGTYTDEVTLNSELNPVAGNLLIIQNNPGDVVTVNATGNDYGFNLNTVDYVTLTGFTVETANQDNIYAQGDNVTISYNKTYGSAGGSGIKVETGTPFTVTNNLSYSNYKYGIEDLSANNTIKNNTADDNGGSYTPATGVTIWSEGWETGSYTGGWTAVNGYWSVYASNANTGSSAAGFVAPSNSTANDILTYSSVSITGYTNIVVACYAKDGGTLETSDILKGEYQIDGGGWVEFFNINNDHNTYAQYSSAPIVTGGTASILEVRFSGTTNRTNEYWYIDDITVVGDEAAPASNTGAGLYVANVAATVENNIFVAKSGNNSYYSLISPGNLVSSDYNTYYTTNTNLFDYNGTTGNTGPMSANDLTGNPLFVGVGDYHIKSTAGSYNGGEWPPLTASLGTWTNDPTDDSPAIDAGNADAFGNEPAPNGGTINQGSYGNTIQASKSPSVVVPISWNGSVSNDWQTLNNWTPNTAIPTATDNVLIPNGMPNYPVIDDGTTTALCDDIEIENSASLTIAMNGQMTVSGIITNAAGNTGLVIQSDASGTGSLIHNNSSGINVTVQQLLAASGRAWHMVGSPISDATVSVFPNTTYLYYYDETSDDYWTGSSYDAGSTLGWTNYNVGALTVGNGYLYNNFQTTLNFVGLLNTKTAGDNITLSYTDQGVTAPNGSTYNNYDGWNFVSNPYTSAIDWNLVNSAGANLYDAIYVWDDVAGTYKTYVDGTNSWDGAATNGGSNYIPAMQGFFVKFNESLGTTGTLTLPSSARVHNAQAFWKGDVVNQTPDNFMRIVVANDNFHDEAVVRFLDNATERMDNRLDAYKLFSHYNYVPQLYTLGNDNTEYSINSLPELSADKTIVVPLRVYCTSQEFSISLSEFNFAQTRVYLRDNFSDDGNVQVYELSPNSRLSFNSNPNNEVDRFELIFEPVQSPTAFDVIDIQDYNLTVYPNPSSGSFYLRVDDYQGDYEVRISTITGQSIYKNTFTGKGYQNVLVENASTGIYLLTVILDNGIVKYERIIIK